MSLHARALQPLPTGAIRPKGWLLNQLRIQADGLSGHLDEFWPSIAQSRWIGGEEEGWERAPYWLDGFIPLAIHLRDERLIGKAKRWIDHILETQHEDGWLGPRDDPHRGMGETQLDPWPLFVLFKALSQWQEATGDHRIVPAMTRAMQRIAALLEEKTLDLWAKMRWQDLGVSTAWLYERTGDDFLLTLFDKILTQGYDWPGHFADFKFKERQSDWLLENHVVNHAMAIKDPAIRYLRLGDRDHWLGQARHYIDTLDTYHGQATGLFTGDESLAGKNPSQGTELCAVVEYMYSLEVLCSVFGEVEFADRLERIAYNALPATFTPDMWAHQYHQQANQVVCKHSPKGDHVYVSAGPDANIFGLEPNFGCCTANMHQGWPKLVSHLWMRTQDGGLAAVAYAPCEVQTQEQSLEVVTDYPFREVVTIHSNAPTSDLLLRTPAWCATARSIADGVEQSLSRGAYSWLRDASAVQLELPMDLRPERRFNDSITVHFGPLLLAVRIGEEFRQVRGELPHADWEVHPTTPWNRFIDVREPVWLEERPIGAYPFSPEGAPLVLHAGGRLSPHWQIEKNAAMPPIEYEPSLDLFPLAPIELIPYGCTHLRVTEIPACWGEDQAAPLDAALLRVSVHAND